MTEVLTQLIKILEAHRAVANNEQSLTLRFMLEGRMVSVSIWVPKPLQSP